MKLRHQLKRSAFALLAFSAIHSVKADNLTLGPGAITVTNDLDNIKVTNGDVLTIFGGTTINSSGNTNAISMIGGTLVIGSDGQEDDTVSINTTSTNVNKGLGIFIRSTTDAAFFSVADNTQLVVETDAARGYGIWVEGATTMTGENYVAHIQNATVTTRGLGSAGICVGYSTGKLSSSALIENTSVYTYGGVYSNGEPSSGINFQQASLGVLNNVNVYTEGAQANGIAAIQGSNLSGRDITITTKGANAHGLSSQMDGSQTELTNVSITTEGSSAYGARVTGKADMILHGVNSIETKNTNAFGLLAYGDNATTRSSLTSDGSLTVSTHGSSAYALYASNADVNITGGDFSTEALGVYTANTSTLSLTDTKVSTKGANAYGIYGAATAGEMNLQNVNVKTTGQGAQGVVTTGAPLTLNGGSIETQGLYAEALRIQNSTSPTDVKNLEIITSGSESHGINMGGSNNLLKLEHVSIKTTGSNAHGITMDAFANNASSTQHISANNVSIDAAGSAVSVNGGYSYMPFPTPNPTGNYLVEFKDSTIKGNESALYVTSLKTAGAKTQECPTTAQIIADHTTVDGHIASAGTSTASVTLTNQSVLTGKAYHQDSSTLNVALQNSSRWEMIADSGVSSLNMELGCATTLHQDGGNFTTLNIEQALSGAGTFNMTWDTQSSSLIKLEGTSTGLFTLNFTTIGDPSLADGHAVLVVQTVDAISGADFVLGNTGGYIKAGAYKYTLQRGDGVQGATDPASWYLVGSLLPIPEPSSSLLSILGVGAMLMRRRRNH